MPTATRSSGRPRSSVRISSMTNSRLHCGGPRPGRGPRDRFVEGEDHGLDPANPFAPAHLRREDVEVPWGRQPMTSKSLETKGWSARELARPCGLATRPRSLGTADAIALPSPTANFLAVLQRSPTAASRGTSSAFVRSAIQSFGRSTRRIRHGEDTRRHAAPPRPVAGGGSTLRLEFALMSRSITTRTLLFLGVIVGH